MVSESRPGPEVASAGLTPEARRLTLISIIVSTPIVVLAIVAGVGAGFAAQSRGDEQRALSIWGSGIAVGVLLIVFVLVFALWLRARHQRMAALFDFLQSADPASLIVIVTDVTVSVVGECAEMVALDRTAIGAICLRGGRLELISRTTPDPVAVLAPLSIVATTGIRTQHRTDFTEVSLAVTMPTASVVIGMLPANVTSLANPSMASLRELAERFTSWPLAASSS